LGREFEGKAYRASHGVLPLKVIYWGGALKGLKREAVEKKD